MAKGAYSFIAYPESADIQKVLDLFVGSGAEYEYILHDKDKHEKDIPEKGIKQGDDKKPHWHIVCGWEKNFPTWSVFKKMCKSCGAVALSLNDCEIRDFDGLQEYLTHKDEKSRANPWKHEYEYSELIQSEAFEPELYIKADELRNKRRAAKKIESSGTLQEIFTLIRENDIDEFCILVDLIQSAHVEMFENLVKNSHFIKGYIDSSRNNKKSTIQVNKALEAYEKKYTEAVQRLREAEKTVELLTAELAEKNVLLSEMYNDRTGENVSNWEI